jgi:membrane protease YdiL (CAAX protease family)
VFLDGRDNGLFIAGRIGPGLPFLESWLAGKPDWVLWIANILAAVLFGLGHLPATAAAGLPLDALVITRSVVPNGLAGIVFGWFYWTCGLEAAVLSHFTGDLVLHVIAPWLAGL